MKLRKTVLIVVSTLMGVIWVVVFIAQIRLTQHLFYKERQLFKAKVDAAMARAMDQLDDTPLIYLGTQPPSEHLTFEDHYPFLKLPSDFSEIVNGQIDYISKNKPCLNDRFIDTLLIDSVLSQAFHEQMVFDAFVWGVYCTQEGRFVYVSNRADTVQMRTSGFDFPLLAYTYPNSFHKDILYLYFTELDQHYSRDMFLSILLLFLMLAAILICFFIIITLIVRESKHKRFRSNLMNYIIHEFKTPITTISLASQLLRDETVQKDPEATQSYLTMVDGEAQSLQTLVEEVLTVFRSEKPTSRERQEISLHALLREVVGIHQLALTECGGTVQWDLRAEKDRIMGERIYLMNAFSNLIDNAIKYRNGSLVLVISTQNLRNMVEIRFKDNGIGIGREDQKRIFEPFARVNVNNAHYVKGYGLGLSYVQYLVRYHGGRIKVESELGEGATFVVSLPILN